MTKTRNVVSLCVLLAGLCGPAQAQTSAEIVSLEGRGEYRPERVPTWQEAKVKQGLDTGHFVRTLSLSRMGILFADRTQIRLNQNSMIQIKPPDADKRRTTINLPAGRAWVQSKVVPEGLTVETPSAVAAIRGTEWELAVDDDGRTTLTVLTGEVDFYNDQGRVLVAASEQAVAEKGRAPVKRVLQNPRERVQWVGAFVVDPRRYPEFEKRGGEPARIAGLIRDQQLPEARSALERLPADPAAQLLLAEFLIYGGELSGALEHLAAAARRFPQDARFDALAGRIHLLTDNAAAARTSAAEALAKDPRSVEAHLVRGDAARFEGNAKAAIEAYRAATSVQPDDARGWLGLGSVHTEREDAREARPLLERALALDPDTLGGRGEIGTLETFADNLQAAREHYERALAAHPDDYVALTGLGVLELKRGRVDAALEALLRASLIEPRYARAHAYTAVAYYQQQRPDAALAELARAAELDPKDPLPHLLASIIHGDLIRPGPALAEAQAAVRLLPYLKSLNQVANNQKGSANLGAAAALFGLEEWSQSLAQQSYLPYWAGSHLFLADRYTGEFNKNSELFQGFLADPTVFGASNRFQTLVPRPGHYASLGGLLARSRDLRSAEVSLTANGYANAAFPFAYFASGGRARVDPGRTDLRGDADSLTAAVGAKPAHELGLFAFAKRFDAELNFAGVPISGDSSRLDAGASYRFSPTSLAWLKLGSGRDNSLLNDAPAGLRFDTLPEQQDVQFRHSFEWGAGHELTWGAESARIDEVTRLRIDQGAAVLDFRDTGVRRSRTLYVSSRFVASPGLLVQADLAVQEFKRDAVSTIRLDAPPDAPIAIEDSLRRTATESNLRLGAVLRLAPAALVRAAWQTWRRPVSPASLQPVATAGIPVDDRFTLAGGRLERLRAQVELAASPRSFAAAFAESSRIDNEVALAGIAIPSQPALAELDRLRNRTLFNLATLDALEGRPDFMAGRIRSAGAAWNQVFNDRWAGYARVAGADSLNTGALFPGRRIPFVAHETAAVGITWVAASRLYVSGQMLYRGHRFTDEANTAALAAGWEGAVSLYWESEDKRWAAQAAINGLIKPDTHSTTLLNVAYRF